MQIFLTLSIYYFSHRFKDETGYSPMDYVINLRMDKAKILLIRTSKTITEIAYEVGYGSSGSFINIFSIKWAVHPRFSAGLCADIRFCVLCRFFH